MLCLFCSVFVGDFFGVCMCQFCFVFLLYFISRGWLVRCLGFVIMFCMACWAEQLVHILCCVCVCFTVFVRGVGLFRAFVSLVLFGVFQLFVLILAVWVITCGDSTLSRCPCAC